MKKIFYAMMVVALLGAVVGCDGISNREAKALILKDYPYTDDKGERYKLLTCMKFSVSRDYAGNFVKTHGLKRTKHIKNLTVFEKHDYKGCAVLRITIANNEPSFSWIPLTREYFVGISKVWNDERKGCEDRAYATFMTKCEINYPCCNLVKDSKGTAMITKKKGGPLFKYVSLDDYLRIKQSRHESVQERRFKKNSQGNWQ